MKHHLTRLSPHQNAKVLALVMAITSAVILIPLGLLATALTPAGQGYEFLSLVVMPIAYGLLTYVMTWIGSRVFNALVPRTGGLEFESVETPG